MYKKLQTKFLALLAIMLMGGSSAWAEEVVYSTCLFGSNYNSKGVSSYTATWSTTNGNFTWDIANGNNNNNGWATVKFGSKKSASVGKITTATAYSEAITKVVVTIDALTADKINSVKLYTSSNNTSWTEAGTFTKATGEQTVTLTTPTANLYYKLEFDCAKGSSNGLITISKVEYYYDNSSSTAAETNVTIDATGITNTDVYVGTEAGLLTATVKSGDNTISGATVSWSSSNENVATISDNGIVTLVAEGTTTITASYAGQSGVYQASTATYELTVTNSTPKSNFNLFSGDLVEGDYLIVYDNGAMNTTEASDRLGFTVVTPENNVIRNSNEAIIWHIAKSGEYWTIYNAAAGAYAASTGVKNKAQMLDDDTDDKALWTVTLQDDGTYEFVNKQNTTSGVNAHLRRNGEYGFACYSESMGGALSLYKKETSQTVTVSSAGYATYVAADNVYFPEGVTAYIVSEVTASSIKLTEVMAVAKDVPVVVKAAAGTYDLEVVAADDCDPVTENKLRVSDGKVKDNILVLANKSNGVGFYRWAGDNLPAGKVYLENPNSSREFFGFDEDVATSISTIDNGQLTMDNAYNLQGQKVGSEYKGIVIVNGKKFINK